MDNGPSVRRPLDLERLRPRREAGAASQRPWHERLGIWRENRWVRKLVPVGVAALFGVVVGVAVAAAINIPRVDSLADFTPARITRVLSREGEVFAEFARQRRILLGEGEVPEVVQNAVVALEDSKFFSHGGVDAAGIVRAAISNLRAGRKKEGASTITMQLARGLFFTSEKSWRRKIEEALTAVELEKRYSKQQLLTLYCNLVNFGHGNYGIAQASLYYFGKPVDQLAVHEAAMLAGIPQRPSDYSPYRRPEKVLQRRDHVLGRMVDEGYLERDDYEAALEEPLGVVPQREAEPFAAYFAEDVRKLIETTYGTQAMLEGGLEVRSTMDGRMQRAAERALQDELSRLDHRKGWRGPLRRKVPDPDTIELETWTGAGLVPGRWLQGVVLESGARIARVRIDGEVYELGPKGIAWTGRQRPEQLLERGDVAWFRLRPADKEGEAPLFQVDQEPQLEAAVLVLESATGAVRAMVGGWDFERSKFNRATQAHRQLGSAFKPFVWGAAIEAGFTPADTLFDAPAYFLGADNRASYRPRNYSREYYGIVTLRRALEKSMNMTAVKLLELVGIQRVIDFAHRAGIQADLPPYPSLALGVADVTPLELAASYAAFANQGTHVEPYLIEKVLSGDGQKLEEHQTRARYVTRPEVAYVLGHVLEGVIDRGTAAEIAGLELDLAGKTGTTDDFSDAWFVGYTPRYTILTWVGYDVRRPIGRKMTGAEAALPMWRRIVEAGLDEGWISKGEKFVAPPGVSFVTVEKHTGLVATPAAEETLVEAFLRGTEPEKTYEARWRSIMELPWYQQRPFYTPRDRERMPESFEDIAREDETLAEDAAER